MTLETAVAHSWKLFQLYLKRVHAQLELLMRFTFFNLVRDTTTASEAAEAVEAPCWLKTVSCIFNYKLSEAGYKQQLQKILSALFQHLQ